LKAPLDLLRCGLALVGLFLAFEMLVILGIAGFIWLAKPARLAVRYWSKTQTVQIITRQPLEVALATRTLELHIPFWKPI
jgi:hypothetical protein